MDSQKIRGKERKEELEDKQIQGTFQHLLDTCLTSRHRKKVNIIAKAFSSARQAHKGVRRLSGEPYITHPIAATQIACEEMGLGSASICSTLLHGAVEDINYTVENIENIFGPKIAQVVDGLTEISGGIFGDRVSAQAESFKKLLLTMSDNIRVILIKICNRLHDMRTLQSQPANKQYKIAGETLYIYASLVNRLDLNKIKTELGNPSFRFGHPEEYADIVNKLSFTKERRGRLFELFTAPIKETLDAMGISYELKARVESPYFIWNKMQTKHVTLDGVYDILAARTIFAPKIRAGEIDECFKIYVTISRIYKSHPDRLRDWLSHSKASGYQTPHVTLMSGQDRWIRVQIRSDRMNEMTEQGFTAHWKYKGEGKYTEDENELNEWLHTIKKILDDPQSDAVDFLDAIKLNLFAPEIFVFTPKGEIKTMSAGYTALDFAFQIHTPLGSHCVGAKVNHKLVPLSHKLQSGDQMEILTGKSQHVRPSWLNFVTTTRTKAEIQTTFRRNNEKTQKQGETLLNTWSERNDVEMTTSVLDKLYEFHNLKKHESLFLCIGNKSVILTEKDLDELNRKKKDSSPSSQLKCIPFIRHDKKDGQDKKAEPFTVGSMLNRKRAVVINNGNIGTYLFPTCCHPIPDDDILGYIDNQNHAKVHKRNYPMASKLGSSYGNRLLDTKWNVRNVRLFNATIEIRGIDRQSVSHDAVDVISDETDVNMRNLSLTSKEGIFMGKIEALVHNRQEVKNIINSLKKVKSLQEIQQIM